MNDQNENDDRRVALWYFRHHNLRVEVFDTEEEAAKSAHYGAEQGELAPVGAQFPDGRAVKCDEWPALRAVEEAAREAWERELEEARSRPVARIRRVRSPFPRYRRTAAVLADTPEWVGTPEEVE